MDEDTPDERSHEYLVGAVLAQLEDADDSVRIAVLADAFGTAVNLRMQKLERHMNHVEAKIDILAGMRR